MPQITDLNVAPYYDDFDKDDNFHRVLFRPGFAIQARELTQLQSILQNQVERFGRHMFQEGTVVIPGQVTYSSLVTTVQLASTFADETIVPSQYFNATNPVIVTGATSGIQAQVIGVQEGTATTQPILILRYLNSGSDNATESFADSENISADISITHNTTYGAAIASATTFSTDAAAEGSAVKIEDGVYFIRGQFVSCAEQTLLLSPNSTTQNARVGFTISEQLITPETDISLTDNAQGSSNYAAKGAHRLKIDLTLSKKDIGSADDTNFVELVTVQRGVLQSNKSELTKYSQIGDTLARRTFDESGDYTTRPFQFDIRESIDNSVKTKEFDGVYTKGSNTDDGGTAAEDLLAVAITPGKAFVRGYEIEKTAITFKDLNKARDVETINAGVTNLDLGNFVRVTNAYNTPDIGDISGETTPYKTLSLQQDFVTTRGSSNGTTIGVARARAFEHFQGALGSTEAEHKLFLFDIQMFTQIIISGNPSPAFTSVRTTGARVKGVTSGAIGFVFSHQDSQRLGTNTVVNLVNVSGTFTVGEKMEVSDSAETDKIAEGTVGGATDTDLTIDTVTNFKFEDVRSVFMDDDDTGQNFTADMVVSRVGQDTDVFRNDGSDANSADLNDFFVLEEDASTRLGIEPRKVALLQEPEKNQALFRMPKSIIKTLLTDDNDNVSDSQIIIRKQFVGTTNSSGAVSFSAGTNETFASFTSPDYALSILDAGGGSGSQGDLVSISGKITGTGTSTVTITDNTILGASAKVKFIGTVTKTAVASRIKTTNLLKQVKVVASDADGAYGVRADDKEISLGRADVYRLQAVYDSEDTTADATAPSMTLSNISGTFTRGEKIVGVTSNARGRVLTTTSPMSYTLNGTFGVQDFAAGETITGDSSGATATVGELTAGSKIITSNFELDTGQRDNVYDIARIVRKPNVASPRGRLLVIFDHFTHGAGEFFSVDSYSSVANQMNFDDIPTYTAARVDPDDPEPTGVFDLADCIDFRSTVANITGASDTVTAVDTITGNSFDFSARTFSGTGSVVVNTPKPNSASTHDFEFFLGKVATVFLDHTGQFRVIEGASAEFPEPPKNLDNAMRLATIFIPPFTFRPTDVRVRRIKTQRFTMRDIGRLKSRIENIETVTALSLLERDAESFEVQDANGLNRFKSGFIVDNFSGHRVGDVLHKDYQVAIDMENNLLRPKCVMRNAKLVEVNNTDTLRTTAGYQKTGDLLTLPYDTTNFIEQPYATRVENVQTYLIHEWVGKIKLSPNGDEWFETEEVPALIINVEGNFNTIEAGLRNEGTLGTVWNAWQTQWSGVISTKTEISHSGANNAVRIERTIETTRTDQTRTGITTSVVERIDEESIGNRIISRAVIPFVRPRTISVTGECFRPGIRLYAFFDGRDMSTFVTPKEQQYSNVTSPVEGSALITNGAGKVEFDFRIPEYRFSGQESNPRFKTGEIEFRLTSSSTNVKNPQPLTAGQSTYRSVGILETEQETIIATRNAEVVQETVNETTSITDTSSTSRRISRGNRNDRERDTYRPEDVGVTIDSSTGRVITQDDVGRTNHGSYSSGKSFHQQAVERVEREHARSYPPSQFGCSYLFDPLSQTFLIEEEGGCFLTSLDLFFASKDNTLPVWVEVRTVVNGYPGAKLLPFGRKVLNPSDVNVDADTGIAVTTFTFDSPIFLEEAQEYCFVVMSNSLEYKVWISQMGETDVSGSNRIISSQPHLGSLFKSQNNRTWDAVQSQDMKFNLAKAVFNSARATISLTNDNIGESKTIEEVVPSTTANRVYVQRLLSNPIVMTNSSTNVKVRHKNHGMYSTSNNVVITGVSSGISTLLGDGVTTQLSSTATSLTILSATNFPTSGTVTIKINNEIMSGTISGTTISSLTRGIGDSDAATHAKSARGDPSVSDTVELYQINGVPLTEINKTHTSISNIGIDSYVITVSSTPSVSGTSGVAEVGGTAVYASENYRFELMQSAISTLELNGTQIDASIRSTSATSPSGNETSFTTISAANAKPFPLGENFTFETTRMVASQINETNELSGAKSMFINLSMISRNQNLSPVIDLNRASMNLVANRINDIDTSSDVFPTTDFNASTEPDGDNNVAVYLTKSIALENPATSIRCFFAAAKKSSSEIKVLFKTLGSDESKDTDEKGYTFFNTTGTTDSTVRNSLSDDDFQEYSYTAGVTDDGIGDPLPEFSQFQIKIVMQGTDAANPPLLKDLRVIALAT
nr:VrlC protein [uncultured Mediterranean phage uvMED]